MNLNDTLKHFRENLDLNKKQFNNQVVSDSFYYKVENGNNNISADLLFSVLKENDISVSEFINKVDNGSVDFLRHYTAIKRMMYNKDIVGLGRYKKKEKMTIGNQIIDGLIEKINCSEVSENIQNKVMNYYCSFNAWNEKQFLAYCLGVKILNLDNILKLESIYSSSIENKYFKSVYKKDYYGMKISIIYQSCLEKRYDIASFYLTSLENNITSGFYLYEKILINFFKNYILYREKNDKQSFFFQNCLDVLSIFTLYENEFIKSILIDLIS